ncbi:MAG: diacylglycerol kinase family protein [Pseudomonadota bacterium]
MPTAIVIVNKASGGHNAGAESAAALLSDVGIKARVLTGPVRDQIRKSRRAAEDLVVVDGGDGTISAAIAAHAGTDRPVGILPAGTMNLLASDNHLPIDRRAAAAVIAAGHVKPLHAGRMGNRLFLHSAFTGLPARIGMHRENFRGRMGLFTKARLAVHALSTLRRDPTLSLTSEEGAALTGPTFVVAVGGFGGPMLPTPERTDIASGQLTALALKAEDAADLARLAVRGVFSTLADDASVETLTFTNAALRAPRSHVYAMMDGESVLLRVPAPIAIVPDAAWLLAPAAP